MPLRDHFRPPRSPDLRPAARSAHWWPPLNKKRAVPFAFGEARSAGCTGRRRHAGASSSLDIEPLDIRRDIRCLDDRFVIEFVR